MRRLWTGVSVLLFLAGSAGLGLTYYAWFGDWPQRTKEVVDHYRSVAANSGRAPDPLITNIFDRESTDLGGVWSAVIDPYDRGDLGGVAGRAQEPGSASDLGEFSFENGLKLKVPGDWNTQDPRLVFYQGSVWYKREFELALPIDGRSFLYFGAANYRARVYLNGKLLGEHRGGFTPFNFEVTDGLRNGTNLLVVHVDNRRTAEDVPTPTTDWHNYGGLTREVLLVRVPETFVRSSRIELDPENPARIRASIVVDGRMAASSVRMRIGELSIDTLIEAGRDGLARVSVEATPARWSPQSPKLYEVELGVGSDRLIDRIGFRTVATRGADILLNDQPVFLRGVSIHEEALGENGRAWSPEHAVALLDVVEELGCNFVRLAHYTHNEHIVREADRRGILVWAEIPVYWNIDFENEKTLQLAKTQLDEMIERDRNRASVVLWSVGNETPETDARNRFMAALAGHVRELDDTRLVTAALVTGEALGGFFARGYIPALVLGIAPKEWVYRVDDQLADVVDVAAVNEYFGWYYSGAMAAMGPFSSHYARRVMLDHMDRIRFETPSEKPIIISEFGAGARFGMHAPVEDLAVYSEEYQALVYSRQVAMLEDEPQVRGWSPWVLKDFRSPMRLYQGVQDYWNRKGLVDNEGNRKQAFEVLKQYYAKRARES